MVASSKLGALLAGHELAEARKRKAIAAAILVEDTRKKKKRRNTLKGRGGLTGMLTGNVRHQRSGKKPSV